MITVSLPEPAWEPYSEGEAVRWNFSNQSATRYDFYWISLQRFTCYINSGGSSFVICRDAKSLDEAKAVCWSHYLDELGAKASGEVTAEKVVSVYRDAWQRLGGTEAERIQAAIDLAVKWGGVAGAHHKDWVIDQIVRILAGERYEQIVAEAKAGDDGPNTYEWEVGIPP